MAVLAQVHEVIRAADDDLDPALAACGPHILNTSESTGALDA